MSKPCSFAHRLTDLLHEQEQTREQQRLALAALAAEFDRARPGLINVRVQLTDTGEVRISLAPAEEQLSHMEVSITLGTAHNLARLLMLLFAGDQFGSLKQ